MRSRTIQIALCAACLSVLSLPAEDAVPNTAGGVVAPQAAAEAGPVWLTSVEQAREVAKKEKKPILVDFTGSDWCGWCKKLEAEVFGTAAFKKWATEHVVLLKLDFPRRIAQDETTKKQNADMKATFGIKGYPTIVFMDAEGKELGRSGYLPGGPEKWTANADSQMAPATR